MAALQAGYVEHLQMFCWREVSIARTIGSEHFGQFGLGVSTESAI
jgi:hypothetical protein